MFQLQGASILVTGDWFFWPCFRENYLEKKKKFDKSIILSRDETDNGITARKFDDPRVGFIGDVRDRERIYRAFRGVDVVVREALKILFRLLPLNVLKLMSMGYVRYRPSGCGVQVIALYRHGH